MSAYFSTTAATLKAVLCFIDATNTPKIAYDDDTLAIPLIKKITDILGDKDGSQFIGIWFDDSEMELLKQFGGICKNISKLFLSLSEMTQTVSN